MTEHSDQEQSGEHGTAVPSGYVTVRRDFLASVVGALDAAATWHEGTLSGDSERALGGCQAALRFDINERLSEDTADIGWTLFDQAVRGYLWEQRIFAGLSREAIDRLVEGIVERAHDLLVSTYEARAVGHG